MEMSVRLKPKKKRYSMNEFDPEKMIFSLLDSSLKKNLIKNLKDNLY